MTNRGKSRLMAGLTLVLAACTKPSTGSVTMAGAPDAPQYEVYAIRYAQIPFRVSSLIAGADTTVLSSTTATMQTWLLPIAPRASGLYRWWLNASLRTSLPPAQPRHYTVPLYLDKGRFLPALQVSSEKEVVLLLTDKAGHVLWRTAGPVSDSKKAALSGFVSRLGR